MKNKSIHNAAGTRTESIASIIILCILACFMFAAYYLGNVWMTNLSIIVVCLGIYYSTKIRCDALDNSRMLQYISSLTYPFYILQLLLWIPSLKIIEWLGIGDSKLDFMVAFILLIFMCILAHELYEKPIKKALKRKLLKGWGWIKKKWIFWQTVNMGASGDILFHKYLIYNRKYHWYKQFIKPV